MRKPNEVAKEIKADWVKISPYAKPYLNAILEVNDIKGRYYEDSAKSVVLYFLANAQSWKGETARRIKKELNDMVKGA